MSDLYHKLCRAVNDRFGSERKDIIEKREDKRSDYLKRRRELKAAKNRLNESMIIHGKGSDEYGRAKKQLTKAEKSFRTIERSYKKEDFKKTAEFVGMDLEEEEVLLFAVFGALSGFLLVIFGTSLVHLTIGLDLIDVLLWIIPLSLGVPLGILIFIANYPEILAERLKAKTIGSAPEAINYLTMSMRVTPSLHKAVLFSAENVEEPMSSGLSRTIWHVYLRKKSSLEESLMHLAIEWGEWNDDLKRSLYVIRSSVLENTQEGLEATLQRANDIIITGTKQKIRDFANSLKTPTTVLFALGILLPLIIGAMLPMLTIGGLDMTSIYQETAAEGGGLSLTHVVLLMNVIIPLGAFAYSYKILINRPGTTSLPETRSDVRVAYWVPLSITVVGTIVIYLLRAQLDMFMPFAWIWAPVVGVSYYLLKDPWDAKKKRKEILELETEFPDALFQLGSRMAEGKSLEKAIEETSQSMKGSRVGDLFKKISNMMMLQRMPLEMVLFGRDGLLDHYPSRMVKASMKSVISASKKSPQDAGMIILQNAEYLKDMQEMESNIRSELSQSVEMMEATSMFFAPVVMGIIVALYSMLHGVFMDISGQSTIAPDHFTMVVVGYLLTMSAVITYFTVGIKYQSDPVEFKFKLGTVLLVCTAVLSGVAIMGRMFLVW